MCKVTAPPAFVGYGMGPGDEKEVLLETSWSKSVSSVPTRRSTSFLRLLAMH